MAYRLTSWYVRVTWIIENEQNQIEMEEFKMVIFKVLIH